MADSQSGAPEPQRQGTPAPYILFGGNAAQALERYQQIFGGTLVLHSYADFSRTDGPSEAIAHGMLQGPVTLFAADAGPGEQTISTQGLMLSLLGSAPPAELHRFFDLLADGGTVLDPLAEKPWGASDGQVRDGFGLHWLIGYEA